MRSPERRTYDEPSYSTALPFFFLGSIGEEQDIYLKEICLGKGADQVTMQYTGGNLAATLLTLGIYSPRTLKVWCRL